MDAENPYESPEHEDVREQLSEPTDAFAEDDFEPEPAAWTANTVLPRHMAALFDNAVAAVLGVMAAQQVSDDRRLLQVSALVAVYLGYFLLSEGLFARSPGKFLAGLVVLRFDGEVSSWRHALVRTAFRVLEVNPLLFGAIPAALCIVFSDHKQRIGDKAAGTVVVSSRHLTG